MLRNRKGVTLIEIMTVVVMAIIMTAIAFPAFSNTRRASSMQSARARVESYVAVTRAVAIRNGGRAYLIRQGNRMWIMADSANGKLSMIVRPTHFDSLFNIQLNSTKGATGDRITFDGRGLAVDLTGSGEKFYITAASGYGAGTRDSVCLTRLGLVLNSCG